MDMKQFADFWRGIFYMISTFIAAVLLYLLAVVWQPIWTEGFKDFSTISQAIESLDKTAQPAVAVVPDMLQQMQQMNQTMVVMDQNIQHMNITLQQQMGLMNHQVNQMKNKFSPQGVMPHNW